VVWLPLNPQRLGLPKPINSRFVGKIGIGAVTRRPLPHHHEYGPYTAVRVGCAGDCPSGRTRLAGFQVICSQYRVGSTNILADWQFCQFARAAEVLIISTIRTIAYSSPEDALQAIRTSKTRVPLPVESSFT